MRRDDSKKWQVHYKIDGIKAWFRRSLDTTDVKEAARLAERLWMKATFDHEEGRPIISKKFKPVAQIVLSRLEAHVKAETARPSYRDYISALKLYLIPFYGNYNVDSITPAVVTQFHQCAVNTWVESCQVVRKTITTQHSIWSLMRRLSAAT